MTKLNDDEAMEMRSTFEHAFGIKFLKSWRRKNHFMFFNGVFKCRNWESLRNGKFFANSRAIADHLLECIKKKMEAKKVGMRAIDISYMPWFDAQCVKGLLKGSGCEFKKAALTSYFLDDEFIQWIKDEWKNLYGEDIEL